MRAVKGSGSGEKFRGEPDGGEEEEIELAADDWKFFFASSRRIRDENGSNSGEKERTVRYDNGLRHHDGLTNSNHRMFSGR